MNDNLLSFTCFVNMIHFRHFNKLMLPFSGEDSLLKGSVQRWLCHRITGLCRLDQDEQSCARCSHSLSLSLTSSQWALSLSKEIERSCLISPFPKQNTDYSHVLMCVSVFMIWLCLLLILVCLKTIWTAPWAWQHFHIIGPHSQRLDNLVFSWPWNWLCLSVWYFGAQCRGQGLCKCSICGSIPVADRCCMSFPVSISPCFLP